MPSIPIRPQGHYPVGSAAYNNNTNRFINKQEQNGNINGQEAGVLSNQQQQIHQIRQQDLANGVNPRQDPTLKKDQVQHRRTADAFANFTPAQSQPAAGSQPAGGQAPLSSSPANPTPSGPGLKNSDSTTGADGTTTVDVGGYSVSFNPTTGTSNITNDATGDGIQNWGDPHTQALGPDAGGAPTGNWSTGTSTFVLPNGERVTETAGAANQPIQSVTITGPYGKRQETIDANGASFAPAQPIDQGNVYTPDNQQMTSWTGADGNVL